MISVLIEAALRSLLVALVVAMGLGILRVRNVLARKAAWGLVLVSALAMPLLLPITAEWHLGLAELNIVLPAHPMTLLEELQALIQARSGSAGTVAPETASSSPSDPAKIERSPASGQAEAPNADHTPSGSAHSRRTARAQQNLPLIPDPARSSSAQSTASQASPTKEIQSPPVVRHLINSPILLALMLYCGIATLFLVRLALGLFITIRLWRSATPVPAYQLRRDAAGLQLRASSKVASPLTIGSAVLLPADYTTWDSEKLSIVLAHERSHIRQGDFYLQMLAGLYAALFWFSPLGWWLKHELAELAEAISDRAGMEQARSRTSYAQILLEFAAAPRRVSTIGVAMARPGSLSRRIERLLNDNSFRLCFAGGRGALAAVALVPLALFASTTLVRVEAAAEKQPLLPARAGASLSLTTPAFMAAPLVATLEEVPSVQTIELSGRPLPELPVTRSIQAVVPTPEAPAPEPASAMVLAAPPAPLFPLTPPAVTVVAGGIEEGGPLSFNRTLSVSGTAQLEVSTGSGNIHIMHGSGNQIHIHGQIHVKHGDSEEQARKIAAEPPIEQSGDTIRVGHRQENWHGISIDYQIEAPAGTLLTANSGSGDIVDEGVGQNAKLETGSGNISATSLEGAFVVKTGSGNIVAKQTGQGDVLAETGSGDIELKDIHGSFRGHTGSGNIKASGTPSASWTLDTGSGNIELWTGNAPLTLDASTGSGSVTSKHEMMVEGTFDQHHIRGTLNGGGPAIRLQTGSGDIEIH